MTTSGLLSFICLQYVMHFFLPVYCTRSPCICSTYSLIVSMFTVLTFDCLLPVHFTIVSMFTVLDFTVCCLCISPVSSLMKDSNAQISLTVRLICALLSFIVSMFTLPALTVLYVHRNHKAYWVVEAGEWHHVSVTTLSPPE